MPVGPHTNIVLALKTEPRIKETIEYIVFTLAPQSCSAPVCRSPRSGSTLPCAARCKAPTWSGCALPTPPAPGRYPSMTGSNTYAFRPNVTKIHGTHTIKGGVDTRWIQYVTQRWWNPLSFSSDTGFTQRDYSRSDGIRGNSIATWLLGTPSSGCSDNNLCPLFAYRYYAFWVEDDWKWWQAAGPGPNPRVLNGMGGLD